MTLLGGGAECDPLHPAIHGPPLEYSDWHCVPALLREVPHLWSGCISGALTEDEFAADLAEAGFSCAQMRPPRGQTLARGGGH